MPLKSRIANNPRRVKVSDQAMPSVARAFPEAKALPPRERLSPFTRSIIDTDAADNASDHYVLQKTLDQASAFAMAEGQRVYVSTHGFVLRLGVATVELREGVDLDLGNSPVVHDRVGVTSNTGSVPFEAQGISHFSLTGGEIHGPGSWRVMDTIYRSLTYAVQILDCSKFEVATRFVNGNSGLLLSGSSGFKASAEGWEMSGTVLAGKGCDDFEIVDVQARNVSAFGIFLDSGSTNWRIRNASKWVDETKFNAGSHPWLWDRRRFSFKKQLNVITGISWANGQLTISLAADPTITGTGVRAGAPALAVNGYVRMSKVTSVPLRAFERESYQITALGGDGTIGWVTVACPFRPGVYTSGGYLGDLTYAPVSVGLETIGVRYSCSDGVVDFWRSRNSADAGASFTGDRIKILSGDVDSCYLVGTTLSGDGSYHGPLRSNNSGHYATNQTIVGGVGGRFMPAASNITKNCVFADVHSTLDLRGPFQFGAASKFAVFSPGGVCGRNMAIAASGIPGRWWLFHTTDEVPEFFGEVSPQDYGFTEPVGGDEEEHTWSCGNAIWVFENIFIGALLPIAPNNNTLQHWSAQGSGGNEVIDDIGTGYGNKMWSPREPFKGPLLAVNAGLLILANAGVESVTLSATPQQVARNFWGARSAGGSTMARIAGIRQRYALKGGRSPGNASTASPYRCIVLTGDELEWLKGKKPKVFMRAWCGADFSDNNMRPSWDISYYTSVTALNASLSPAGGTDVDLDKGAFSELSTDASDVIFTGQTTVPSNAAMMVLRMYYTPVNTIAKPVAGANDWWAFEEFEIVPNDSDFSFAREDRTVTQGRINALAL